MAESIKGVSALIAKSWSIHTPSSPKKEPPKFYNQSEILKRRSELKKAYLDLSEKHPFLPPFDDFIGRIYLEKRAESFLDILETLFKSDEAKEAIVNNNQLFQDVWNFFPHKILRGKCPAESFQKNWRAKNASHTGRPPGNNPKEREEFKPFDDCPVCP